jgi:hypothetical protein
MKKITFLLLLVLFQLSLFAKTLDPKKFGIVPNTGKNLTDNFIALSNSINKLGGNTTVIIPKGIYIIGKQSLGLDGVYLSGHDVVSLKNCNNVKISGMKGTKFIYANNLKFGSFNPQTGELHPAILPFYDKKYIAQIGCALRTTNCNNIEFNNIEIEGNINNTIIGGKWGDTGYQLWHYGVYISNSKNIKVTNINAHHFALDGISVSGSGREEMNISLNNCKFEYNGRQGFSWIGGKGVVATNCKFNHTGKSKIQSSPGAGLDIEAEGGNEVINGQFINCEFINNSGCGIIADTGPSKNINFKGCTFIGVSNWSVWVQKPSYTFNKCTFNGSFVHGYITTDFKEATKFYNCIFEDKKYKGQDVYGGYLLESDGRKKMIFEDCIFTTNVKKVMWFNGVSTKNDEEKAIFKNCTINVNNKNLAQGDFYTVMRKMILENLTLNQNFPKEKKYYFNEDNNVNKGVKTNYLKN